MSDKKLIESGSPLPLYHTPPEVMEYIKSQKSKSRPLIYFVIALIGALWVWALSCGFQAVAK
jgi:hypothetical protein